MGIISVAEVANRRSVSVDARWGRRGTRTFRVRANNMAMGCSYAVFAPGIPLPGAFWLTDDEFDFGLRALEASAEQDAEDPFTYWVTVPFSSRGPDPQQQTSGGGGGGQPPNDQPTQEPPRWQWGKVHDTEVLFTEAAVAPAVGRPIVNSAGRPFAPRPTVDASRLSLTYTRNERGFDAAAMHVYWDTVNDDPFLGFGSRMAKCGSITGQTAYRNGVRFDEVTYYFEFRLDRWDLQIVDHGVEAFNNDNPAGALVLGPIYRGGVQVDRFLDGQGFVKEDQSTPVYRTFQGYLGKPFAPLNIYTF